MVLVLAGCGSHEARAPHAATGADLRASLVAKAKQAFEIELRLDYRRPFLIAPYDRTYVHQLYFDACSRGKDKQSCWMAAALTGPQQDIAEALVRDNCRAGDRMSCRAIVDRSDRYRELPGAAGRFHRCHPRNPEENWCDEEALRRECDEGFALSCLRLVELRPGFDDEEGMWQRERLERQAYTQALMGCGMNILSECYVLRSLSHLAQDVLVEQKICKIADSCLRLALLLKTHDPTMWRLTLERACQYDPHRSAYACHMLSEAYLDGSVREPVKGRGRALKEWLCRQSDECLSKRDKQQ